MQQSQQQRQRRGVSNTNSKQSYGYAGDAIGERDSKFAHDNGTGRTSYGQGTNDIDASATYYSGTKTMTLQQQLFGNAGGNAGKNYGTQNPYALAAAAATQAGVAAAAMSSNPYIAAALLRNAGAMEASISTNAAAQAAAAAAVAAAAATTGGNALPSSWNGATGQQHFNGVKTQIGDSAAFADSDALRTELASRARDRDYQRDRDRSVRRDHASTTQTQQGMPTSTQQGAPADRRSLVLSREGRDRDRVMLQSRGANLMAMSNAASSNAAGNAGGYAYNAHATSGNISAQNSVLSSSNNYGMRSGSNAQSNSSTLHHYNLHGLGHNPAHSILQPYGVSSQAPASQSYQQSRTGAGQSGYTSGNYYGASNTGAPSSSMRQGQSGTKGGSNGAPAAFGLSLRGTGAMPLMAR
jgi:hypothetical protein